jgi:GT2 family glycosyltransferase
MSPVYTGGLRWGWGNVATSELARNLMNPTFSIIICSHRAERRQAIQAHYRQIFANESCELIMITDARSMCEGYNRGFAQATGELVIFSHDDVEFFIDDLPQRLRAHLQRVDLVGMGGTQRLTGGAWAHAGDPHTFMAVANPTSADEVKVMVTGRGPTLIEGIQAVDGCFFACKREVAKEVPFDEQTFDHFHLYDLDFSFRAHMTGFKLGVARDLAPLHLSGGTWDETWRAHRSRFEVKFAAQLALGEGKSRSAQLRMPLDQYRSFLIGGGVERLIKALG